MLRRLLICVIFGGAVGLGSPPSGQQLFTASCAGCHGLDGRGGEHAPDIVTSAHARQLAEAEITRIVRNGIAAAGMPAFGSSLSNEQLDAVVKYVRSLQGQGIAGSVSGDASRGRRLFFGKAGCSECHLANGQGGFLGDDLSGYGQSHSALEVRDAIVDPNRNLNPRRRVVVVSSRDGKKYTGVLRNEDNFSLQMQTADGRFHFFDKRELGGIERLERSIMPADYGSRLNKSELDDLAAFLGTTAKDQTSKGNRDEEE